MKASSLKLCFVCAFFAMGSATWAGSGIATSTFTIPNNTGVAVNDLHVTLFDFQSGETLNSLSFSTVSGSGPFDFSGGSVAPGLNDTLFTVASGSDFGLSPATGLQTYWWTVDGVQQGAEFQPLYPTVTDGELTCLSPACYNPDYYSFDLQNSTLSDLDYDQMNLNINGSQVLTNASGSVGTFGLNIATGGTALSTFDFSFRDVSTGVTQEITLVQPPAPAPEPGTLPLLAVILAAAFGLTTWRRLRRA